MAIFTIFPALTIFGLIIRSTMIRENYSLKSLNTFGIDARSGYFFEARTQEELTEFISEDRLQNSPFLIIGEGSNILFTGDYNGWVIHPNMKGIQILEENDKEVLIKAMAGEHWDDLVSFTTGRGWGGLENLSLIPGSVGASPVQNIGAYGVEIKDRIMNVEGILLPENNLKTIPREGCHFSYRNSIFKQELKNRFIICSVAFRLDKNPDFILDYGPVREQFSNKDIQDVTGLRETIIGIRNQKLPDPGIYGNAGSFFKNPVIDNTQLEILRKSFPGIPSYSKALRSSKIPSAWLIEKAGWKGVREGNAGTWPSQPLVIVNYGGATGAEILQFSRKIQDSVKNIFGIDLESEVNII